jgi:hypothetical protein
MKITIDFGNIFKKEFWNRVDFIATLFAVVLGLLWVFIIPLFVSIVIQISPNNVWFNSLSEFWRPASTENFILLNLFLFMFIFFAFVLDIIDESDWEDENNDARFFLSALAFFVMQEWTFREIETFETIQSDFLYFFPLFLFFVKIYLRRKIQLKSKLNSNAEMLRELTRTDEELRLKILEKKLDDLNK